MKEKLLSVKVHGVHEVRKGDVHTAELLVHEPSASQVEMALESLTNISLTGSNKIVR
jgi:hypothetical protein